LNAASLNSEWIACDNAVVMISASSIIIELLNASGTKNRSS
jgi:hypothetical protein